MTRYELFNDVEDTGDWMKVDLYESGYTLGLDRFKGVIVTDEQKKELKHNPVKQFEITMEYLSDLLRKGKLKMKTYSYRKELVEESEENCVTYTKTDSKEWNQDNIEEGLNFVIKKWNSFESKEDRSHFEDFGVMFTLPENEWMM